MFFCSLSVKRVITSRVPVQHNLDLDAEHTLSELDVLDSALNKVVDRVTGVNHQAIDELHGLGTLTTELAGHDYLAALGARLHDEAKNTVASSLRTKRNEKHNIEKTNNDKKKHWKKQAKKCASGIVASFNGTCLSTR